MLPTPCAKREGRQNGARAVRGVHAQRTRIMLRHLILCGARLRRRRLALSNGMGESKSPPSELGLQNGLCHYTRTDTARVVTKPD